MADNMLTLETLLPRLSRYGRLMGIDLGTKTIGLALSDVERRIATPLEPSSSHRRPKKQHPTQPTPTPPPTPPESAFQKG